MTEILLAVLGILGGFVAWLLGKKGKEDTERFWDEVHQRRDEEEEDRERLSAEIEKAKERLVKDEGMSHEEAVNILRDRFGWDPDDDPAS